MNKKKSLFQTAKDNPQGVKFSDLEKLATYVGFRHFRTSGSHKAYKRAENPSHLISFQPDKHDKKMAKAYQVRQLIDFIQENGLESALED